MERIKNLPKIDPPKNLELIVGDVVEMAEISVTDDAWVKLYEKTNGKYTFLNHQGISQHGSSKNKPKKFPVYIFGVVDEGKEQSLAYAQSIHEHTNEVNIVRLTNIKQITKYRELTYLD